MYIGLMPQTPKRKDLTNDTRCVVHSLPGPNDSEICVRGTVQPISAEQVEELIHKAPTHVRIARDTNMYEIDIERVNCTVFENVGLDKRPSPTRTRWVAAQPKT